MNLKNRLQQGLDQLQLKINEQQIEQCLQYLALLEKWNKAYNLTAIRQPEEMLVHHLLDSLAVVPYFADAQAVLDVGTGAGLPGIPLAIVYPQSQFTLLDSNGKKTRFVQQAKSQLGLKNVQVENRRVEELNGQSFDMITSRAFADLALMVELTAHLLKPEGKMAAMKGPKANQELACLEELGQYTLQDLDIHPVNVPMLDGQRNLVSFSISQNQSQR